MTMRIITASFCVIHLSLWLRKVTQNSGRDYFRHHVKIESRITVLFLSSASAVIVLCKIVLVSK